MTDDFDLDTYLVNVDASADELLAALDTLCKGIDESLYNVVQTCWFWRMIPRRITMMMTAREREARRLFKWAVNHFGGDLRKLELALWAQVKAGHKLPTINTAQQRTGAPLKPYKGVS